MSGARYAIYFVPPAESALYRFGAAALGYDSYLGCEVPSLSGNDLGAAEWRQLTAEPRRYGFHATLKAPFSLHSAYSEDDLAAEFLRFCGACTRPVRFAATIRLLDGFAAVVPAVHAPSVGLLADACVRDFDRFREPMSEIERARRLTQNLTERQIGHLDRWGYPYVFEDFRFHMTLTGRLPAERSAAALELLHATLKREPVAAGVAIETVALLRQDHPDASFRIIRQAFLLGAETTAATSRQTSTVPAAEPDAFGGGLRDFAAENGIATRH